MGRGEACAHVGEVRREYCLASRRLVWRECGANGALYPAGLQMVRARHVAMQPFPVGSVSAFLSTDRKYCLGYQCGFISRHGLAGWSSLV